MKKKLLKYIYFLFVVLLIYCFYTIYENFNFYKPGENDTIEIKKDDIFSIKLISNPSTGYHNCWANQNKCTNIELLKNEFKPDFSYTSKQEGDGGNEIWTFKATQIGIDTIFIKSIFFEEDCNEKNTNIKNATNYFIIKVEK